MKRATLCYVPALRHTHRDRELKNVNLSMKSQIQPSLYSVLWLPFEREAALNPLLRAYDEFAS